MRKWLQALWGCRAERPPGEKPGSIAQLDADAPCFQEGEGAQAPLLIDVRSAADYEREHIPGSRLLPLEALAARYDELPRDQLIVLICGGGSRSEVGCEQLAQLGFTRVANLRGGLSAWKRAGLPYRTR